MKKIIAVLLMVGLFAPTAAMAVDTFKAEQITVSGNLISTLSNKVSLIVASGGNAYAAASGHENGNKVFASTSADTKIYVSTEDPPVLEGELTDSDTNQFSGRTPL